MKLKEELEEFNERRKCLIQQKRNKQWNYWKNMIADLL